MTNEIATPVSFEDRMLQMFRDNVANLMTEEELKKIMDRGMEKLLFSERPNHSSAYNAKPLPPLAMELTLKAMEPMLQTLIDKWVAENTDLLSSYAAKYFGQNAEQFAMNMFANMFGNTFLNMKMSLQQDFNSSLQRNGLRP